MVTVAANVLLVSALWWLGAVEETPVPSRKSTSAAKSSQPLAPKKAAPAASRVSSQAAAFFTAHNHSIWWKERIQYQPESHGFVGTTHQRLDVVLLSVQRDAQQPTRYYVRGKNRYKGVISSFTGTLTLEQLDKQTIARTRNKVREEKTIVTGATGRFAFQLSPASRGRMSGTINLDMLPEPYPSGTPQPTGYTFEGEWQRPDGSRRDVIWSDNLFALGNAVLGDFEIGGRGPEINPKYYSAGWGTYWENDEWWAASVARRK